jgi:hypothetical protein
MKTIKWLGTLSLTAAGTVAAVLCASRWAPAQTAPATRIVVAAVDIDVGQRLAPRFVKLIDWPAGKIPRGAFSDPHKLDGRVLRASILHGEPLTESGLQPLGPSAVRLHLGVLVALAVRRGETKQSDLARSVGLSSIKRNNQAVFRDHDPDTAAWLSLLGEPQAPGMPTGAGKPARM